MPGASIRWRRVPSRRWRRLGKFLPDVDRPNEGVFAWQDEDESWLALRYDLTAPLARYYAQHRPGLPTPYRRYQTGPVWRNEKPGPGRFKQFYQCDADTVGSGSVAADAEMCVMLGEALEAAGIARGDYLIRVNNRKVLNGVLEVMGHDPSARLGNPGNTTEQSIDAALQHVAVGSLQRADILRTIDKFDKAGRGGRRAASHDGPKGRLSERFHQGRWLSDYMVEPVILQFLDCEGGGQMRKPCPSCAKRLDRRRSAWKGSQELETIARFSTSAERNGVIDPSVVRGLGYYTGPVLRGGADLRGGR